MRLRLRLRDRRRRAQGSRPGGAHRAADLRQGLGADRHAPVPRRRGEAHHLALLHPLGRLHPRQGPRARTSSRRARGRRPRRCSSAAAAPLSRAGCQDVRLALDTLKSRAPARESGPRSRRPPARALKGSGGARRARVPYPRAPMVAWLLDLVLHLDRHLVELLARFDLWLYAILFAVIFCETGLVVTPFLPGDSLLFACGALAAVDTTGTLAAPLLTLVLALAAVLGNIVQLRHRAPDRAAGLLRPLSAAEGGVPAAHRGVLRALRGLGGPAVALPADHPHLRALRGRRRAHALRALPRLQPCRRHPVGGGVHLGRLPVRQHPVREGATSAWSRSPIIGVPSSARPHLWRRLPRRRAEAGAAPQACARGTHQPDDRADQPAGEQDEVRDQREQKARSSAWPAPSRNREVHPAPDDEQEPERCGDERAARNGRKARSRAGR